MSRAIFRWIAALGLLLFAAYQAFHDASGMVWPGFTRLIDGLGAFYVPLWTAAAIGLLLNRTWGWVLGFMATFFLLMHGIGINLGGSKQGVPFTFGAIAIAALVWVSKPWLEARGRGSARGSDEEIRVSRKRPPLRPAA